MARRAETPGEGSGGVRTGSGTAMERCALEARAEVLRFTSADRALRRGESDRVEIGGGDTAATDVVYGRDVLEVGGDLTEQMDGDAVVLAKRQETTIEGRLEQESHSDMTLLGGAMTDIQAGAVFVAAGMSDDLVIGGGSRMTAAADFWLTGLTGKEEKPFTLAADGALAEMYGTLYEREYGAGTHNAGFASFSGAVFATQATGFRPLMRVAMGVRNLAPGGGGGGGGAAPASPSTPAAGGEGAAAGAEGAATASDTGRSLIRSGARLEDTQELGNAEFLVRDIEDLNEITSVARGADTSRSPDTAATLEDLIETSRHAGDGVEGSEALAGGGAVPATTMGGPVDLELDETLLSATRVDAGDGQPGSDRFLVELEDGVARFDGSDRTLTSGGDGASSSLAEDDIMARYEAMFRQDRQPASPRVSPGDMETAPPDFDLEALMRSSIDEEQRLRDDPRRIREYEAVRETNARIYEVVGEYLAEVDEGLARHHGGRVNADNFAEVNRDLGNVAIMRWDAWQFVDEEKAYRVQDLIEDMRNEVYTIFMRADESFRAEGVFGPSAISPPLPAGFDRNLLTDWAGANLARVDEATAPAGSGPDFASFVVRRNMYNEVLRAAENGENPLTILNDYVLVARHGSPEELETARAVADEVAGLVQAGISDISRFDLDGLRSWAEQQVEAADIAHELNFIHGVDASDLAFDVVRRDTYQEILTQLNEGTDPLEILSRHLAPTPAGAGTDETTEVARGGIRSEFEALLQTYTDGTPARSADWSGAPTSRPDLVASPEVTVVDLADMASPADSATASRPASVERPFESAVAAPGTGRNPVSLVSDQDAASSTVIEHPAETLRHDLNIEPGQIEVGGAVNGGSGDLADLLAGPRPSDSPTFSSSAEYIPGVNDVADAEPPQVFGQPMDLFGEPTWTAPDGAASSWPAPPPRNVDASADDFQIRGQDLAWEIDEADAAPYPAATFEAPRGEEFVDVRVADDGRLTDSHVRIDTTAGDPADVPPDLDFVRPPEGTQFEGRPFGRFALLVKRRARPAPQIHWNVAMRAAKHVGSTVHELMRTHGQVLRLAEDEHLWQMEHVGSEHDGSEHEGAHGQDGAPDIAPDAVHDASAGNTVQSGEEEAVRLRAMVSAWATRAGLRREELIRIRDNAVSIPDRSGYRPGDHGLRNVRAMLSRSSREVDPGAVWGTGAGVYDVSRAEPLQAREEVAEIALLLQGVQPDEPFREKIEPWLATRRLQGSGRAIGRITGPDDANDALMRSLGNRVHSPGTALLRSAGDRIARKLETNAESRNGTTPPDGAGAPLLRRETE